MSLDLLWALWDQLRLIWPDSCTYLPPKSTVAPKVHSLNRRNTCCLFRYSTDAGFTKLIVRGLIHCSWGCTERFPFFFSGRTARGIQLWFWPRLCVWATLRHLFPIQARRGKQQLIRAHLLSQAGERRGNGNHHWDVQGVPVAAEASMKLQQTDACHAFSWRSWPWITGPSSVAGCTGFREGVGRDLRLLTGPLVAAAAAVASSSGDRDNSCGSCPPLELA